MAGRVTVEVVFALEEHQALVELQVAHGTNVADVIAQSRIQEEFPTVDLAALDAGIWGRTVSRDTRVRDGDRVELYRPLQLDPREARRLRARAGKDA